MNIQHGNLIENKHLWVGGGPIFEDKLHFRRAFLPERNESNGMTEGRSSRGGAALKFIDLHAEAGGIELASLQKFSPQLLPRCMRFQGEEAVPGFRAVH